MTPHLSAAAIAAKLEKSRKRGSYYMCRCPAHDDQKPSLAIGDDPSGRIWMKCYAGCSTEKIRAALEVCGIWPAEMASTLTDADCAAPPVGSEKLRILSPIPLDVSNPFLQMKDDGTIDCYYEYRDREGRILMVVTRKEVAGTKTIFPNVYVVHKNGTRSWLRGSLPKPWPLYGLRDLELRSQTPVLVVEGEKTADAVSRHFTGYNSITWPGGASAVDHTDWNPLRGRDVVLWPDADEPGRAAMDRVRKRLIKAGARSIRLVQIPADMPEGWDLADEVPEGVDVQQLLDGAVDVGGGLRRHIRSAREVAELDIPPKSCLVEEWLPRGGLAMVWAERGLGKTWFALELALCVAEGRSFLAYKVPKSEAVLYIDGEMPLVDTKERLKLLRQCVPENLYVLSSETLFTSDTPLNINDEADQERIVSAIADMAQEGIKPGLVILDNLSSLTAGIDENDNSALDGILRFLRRLRHDGITVLFVHHANKSGDQRGASRREDLLDTSIKLARPDKTVTAHHDGGHFVVEFTKTRGRTPKPHKLEIKLMQTADGRVSFSWSQGRTVSPRDEILRAIAMEKPKTQAEVAEHLGRAKGTISKDFGILG